jgi:hypothetical protein
MIFSLFGFLFSQRHNLLNTYLIYIPITYAHWYS